MADAGYEELEYDLGEWDPMGRRLLDSTLTRARIPFHWDGAILVVPATARESVEEAFDQVETAQSADLPGDDEALTTYEVGTWPHTQLDELDRTLLAEEIRHWWDDAGDLVVLEADETHVDAIIGRFEEPSPRGDANDGSDPWEGEPDAQQVMSTMFVAADILRKNPVHPDAVTDMADVADLALTMKAPFGFTDRDWDRIVDSARVVRSELESGDDPDAVMEVATALRDVLRPYV